MIARLLSKVFALTFRRIRWIYYTLTLFMWHKPAPFSTVIYGRIRTGHLPIRVEIGEDCCLGDNLHLTTSHTGLIKIGNKVNLNVDATIVAVEGIEIGDNVAIGEFVSIRDQDHVLEPGKGVHGATYKTAPVKIGDNVWIGRGVYIGKGTIIGDNCVIGANSVVHGTFPPNSVIAGMPAKVKRTIDSDPDLLTESSS